MSLCATPLYQYEKVTLGLGKVEDDQSGEPREGLPKLVRICTFQNPRPP